jgi:hypothetical protein
LSSRWEQLRDSIALMRELSNGSHVPWYRRGVTDIYARQLTDLYAASGAAVHPVFGAGWRPGAIVLCRLGQPHAGVQRRRVPRLPAGRYRLIGHDRVSWSMLAGGLRSPQAAAW